MDGKKIENLLENKLMVAGKVKIVTCGHIMSHDVTIVTFDGKLRRRDNVPPK